MDIAEVKFEEYIDAEDFIKANEYITHQERICRIAIGYIIFVVVLGVSTIATFFLVAASTSTTIENLNTSSVLVSAIIAVFMTMVNMVWQRVCVWLTHLECHATWTKFRQHNTLKFFLFKMLNVLTMYASRILVPRISYSLLPFLFFIYILFLKFIYLLSLFFDTWLHLPTYSNDQRLL